MIQHFTVATQLTLVVRVLTLFIFVPVSLVEIEIMKWYGQKQKACVI